MRSLSPTRLLYSKETVRWLALVGVVGAGVGLGVVLFTSRPAQLVPLKKDSSSLTLQSFQTASHFKNRLQLRVSGDSLTLAKSRLWGPFRLGFAQSLLVRNLTIETFPDPDKAFKAGGLPLSFKQTWASLTPSLKQTLESLLPHRAGGVIIVSAKIKPLTIIERRKDQETVLLKAASCHTTQRFARIICQDGVVRVEGKEMPFRKWRYDIEADR